MSPSSKLISSGCKGINGKSILRRFRWKNPKTSHYDMSPKSRWICIPVGLCNWTKPSQLAHDLEEEHTITVNIWMIKEKTSHSTTTWPRNWRWWSPRSRHFESKSKISGSDVLRVRGTYEPAVGNWFCLRFTKIRLLTLCMFKKQNGESLKAFAEYCLA